MHTGVKQQTPLEWPFTQLNNEDQRTQISMFALFLPWAECNLLFTTGFLRGIRNIIGLAL